MKRRWPWIAALVAIALALFFTFFEVRVGGEIPDARPMGSVEDIAALPQRTDTNVLFILVDMLRADRLGTYGYARETSPEIDRLAASGVRFARHLSQSSWTKASMASLWTGMNPPRAGVTRFDHVIPEEARMPAEILRDAGFFTAGIWRNGWVSEKFGFAQGFESYTRPATTPLPPNLRRENPTLSERGTDEDVLLAAVEFLRIHGHKRWFLYLHMMDVHEYVYDQETALFGGSYSDIYDNSIRRVDSVIASMMDYLADMGLASETLVVIGSDHGEAFLERGHEGHARQVYRESTEVPLVVALPFRLEEGVVVEQRTRNVDVWPTILDLVGLAPPPGLDGRSVLPDVLAAARGEPAPQVERTAVAHLDQNWGKQGQPATPTIAIADGPLRYVRVDVGRQRLEHLFDAARDPAELRDLADEDPESLERLRAVADENLAQSPAWEEDVPTRELGELELNQLRALGYALP